MGEKIRLQVFLSRNGVCSRRAAMDMVKDGYVEVNGIVENEPSFPVDPDRDRIAVDGKIVETQKLEYVMLHKPRGYVTTKAQHGGQKNIYKILSEEYKNLLPVGRLDKDTEGLLLLTNDGDLSFALTHPKHIVDKTYFVIVKGDVKPQALDKLKRGLVIEGGKTAPSKIKEVRFKGKDTSLKITIHEGKKRQIRLMFDAVGHRVKYLKRLTQGPIGLGTLALGKTRHLDEKETKALMKIKHTVIKNKK